MLGKIFGAGLGWVLGGGPIGAVIGMAIGSMFDNSKVVVEKGNSGRRPITQQGDFSLAMVVLSAAVMKADGKLLKSELEFVKRFFVQQFGEDVAKEQMLLLREVLKQDLNLEEICADIKRNMRIIERRLIMQYLFSLAKADGVLDISELRILERIALFIGIDSSDFVSMKTMFGAAENTENFYQTLGVDASISDEDLKKTYRKLVLQYHPDKVAHLGAEHAESAKQKFQKIQAAYSKIKQQRGL